MAYKGFLLAACITALSLMGSAADKLDLPVATSGFDQWIGVVAKAMTFGAKDQQQAVDNLKKFQSQVQGHLSKTGKTFEDLATGDITSLLSELVTPKIQISKPVFFSSTPATLTDSFDAVQVGFTGVGYSPCAVVVNPGGVSVGATGIAIQPQGLSISPTGVQVQPQGASISPSLIVIGAYDTVVAGQGLNIAPALIAIAPVKTVINPVGPLSIGDSLISATVPAIPGP